MFILSTYLHRPSHIFSCFSVLLLPSHFLVLVKFWKICFSLTATAIANRKFIRIKTMLPVANKIKSQLAVFLSS